MKHIIWISALFMSSLVLAQALPHGMVYGRKPNLVGMLTAPRLETFMGKRTRISTTISGTIIKVTKSKGGWFEVDAGKGKVIAAHFKNYDVTLPPKLKGRHVIIEGVAQKQFIADDMQHFAGDTVSGKKQHRVKTDPNKKIMFEVTGLIID